ncbi:hypothetical protein OROGR_011181 [Orobanche gracilis]
MGRLLLLTQTFLLIWLLYYTSKCSSTVYIVGENGGWDISTDIDSWKKDKTFSVGDTLLFQYSQYHSVSEVTKKSYDVCNTTEVLQTNRSGNTSVALTGPGDMYFVCGKRLHCLGGMKLHVNVVGNQVRSPVGAPEARSWENPGPESSTTSNLSDSAFPKMIIMDKLIVAVFGLLAIYLWI